MVASFGCQLEASKDHDNKRALFWVDPDFFACLCLSFCLVAHYSVLGRVCGFPRCQRGWSKHPALPSGGVAGVRTCMGESGSGISLLSFALGHKLGWQVDFQICFSSLYFWHIWGKECSTNYLNKHNVALFLGCPWWRWVLGELTSIWSCADDSCEYSRFLEFEGVWRSSVDTDRTGTRRSVRYSGTDF